MEYKLIKKLQEGKKTLRELARECRMGIDRVRLAIHELGKQHFDIKHEKGYYWIDTSDTTYSTRLITPKRDFRKVRYGTPSDLHIGCKLHDKEGFLDYYKRVRDQGVSTFFIPGDLTDGDGHVYKGQMNFLSAVTQQDQVDLFCEEMPQEEGVEYFIIGGNHDWSWSQKGAPESGKLIESQRPDIHYLGQSVGDVILEGVRIRLIHGAGGGAYSISYPVQRYARNLAIANQPNNPRILHVGHYHRRLDGMDVEGGMTATLCGNFQRPNEWYMRRGYVGPRGAHIIELETEHGRVISFNSKWMQVD